ncbi:MAG: xanthine dehydrogenase family protein subunit M [Burkholderiales bacterium]|jgi:xanthine dehydrogenase FAD-binding subunit|nr:xanthine dehydrogenase family protein subunit M [Burkholderiales bacterium]
MAVEEYWAPASLPDALEHLRGGEVTILAGGTDLMPQSHAGRVTLKRGLLNVRRVPELHRVERAEGAVRIGALCTITELMRDPLVREHFGLLADACDHFASDQLRNAATIGGNVCNASPAGDTLVPLLALDAEVELASKPDGRVETRRVPLADFFTGPGRTARAPNELLCAIRLPLPPPGFVGRFFKFGTRPALDISAISIAIGGVRSGRALTHVRVAYGAVAPVPLRARKTEAALEGAPLDAAAIDRIAATARDEVRPIDDVRASAWYRKELVFNMTRRILGDVAQA